MKITTLIAAGTLLVGVVTGSPDSANQYPFAAGKITKLDATAKHLTLQTSQGALTLAVTEKTYLIESGAVISFDKLKLGSPVKLNYYTNTTGQAFVRRLKIDPAVPVEPETKPK